MRQILIKRLEDIAIREKDFPASLMRWRNTNFRGWCLHMINFSALESYDFTDEDLLDLYEYIIRRLSKQM